MYLVLQLLVIIVTFCYLVFKNNKFIKYFNDLLRKYLNIINYSFLIIDTISIFLVIISKSNIDIQLIIITVVQTLITILLAITNKKQNKIKDRYVLNLILMSSFSYLTIYTASLINHLNRVGVVYSNILSCIQVFFLLVNIVYVISFLMKNKDYVSLYSNAERDYIKEIKFNSIIEIKKLFDYSVIMLIYILLICSNIPLSYVAYVILLIVLYLIYTSKVKKIANEKKKLEKNIHRNIEPGAVYAFCFNRDIERTRQMHLIVIFLVISFLTYYLEGESAFIFITLNLFAIYLYVIIYSKKDLIKLLYSLDENLIDQDVYSILINDDLTEIKKIKYITVNNVFYKIIYVSDNKQVFESNLVLYDPTNYIKDIKIFINKDNLDDYIFMIEDLYY